MFEKERPERKKYFFPLYPEFCSLTPSDSELILYLQEAGATEISISDENTYRIGGKTRALPKSAFADIPPGTYPVEAVAALTSPMEVKFHEAQVKKEEEGREKHGKKKSTGHHAGNQSGHGHPSL